MIFNQCYNKISNFRKIFQIQQELQFCNEKEWLHYPLQFSTVKIFVYRFYQFEIYFCVLFFRCQAEAQESDI